MQPLSGLRSSDGIRSAMKKFPGSFSNGFLCDMICLSTYHIRERCAYKKETRQFVIYSRKSKFTGKGGHLKNDDSREKIELGAAWRNAAGNQYRYYMVFQDEENLPHGAVSMGQFVETIKAL